MQVTAESLPFGDFGLKQSLAASSVRGVPIGGFAGDRRAAEGKDDEDTDDFEGPHIVAGLLMISVVGTVCFFVGNYIAPRLSEWAFTMSVILIYVATSVAIDLFISSQKEEDDDGEISYSFDPICVVMFTEVIKLIVSSVLYVASRFTGPDAPLPFIPPTFSMVDVKWLAFPAVLFGTNNILLYYVILKNDISTFGIFRDTTILWTAMMWKGWFGVPLGDRRVQGIALIFFGLATSEVSSFIEGQVFTWTFLWVCLLTLVNSLAGVSNEYAFKRNMQIDLNLQNSVLYIMGIMFAIVTLLITNPGALRPGHFTEGFTTFTFATSLLQAFSGLIVSRVLKYADAVTKTVAACLRGPTLILLAPLVISESIGVFVMLSSCVIAFGCWVYLREGPMKVEDKDASKSSDVANTEAKDAANSSS